MQLFTVGTVLAFVGVALVVILLVGLFGEE